MIEGDMKVSGFVVGDAMNAALLQENDEPYTDRNEPIRHSYAIDINLVLTWTE